MVRSNPESSPNTNS
jgi:hypothetical protein